MFRKSDPKQQEGIGVLLSHDLKAGIIKIILEKKTVKMILIKKNIREDKEQRGIPSYVFSSTLFLRNSCIAAKKFLVKLYFKFLVLIGKRTKNENSNRQDLSTIPGNISFIF